MKNILYGLVALCCIGQTQLIFSAADAETSLFTDNESAGSTFRITSNRRDGLTITYQEHQVIPTTSVSYTHLTLPTIYSV